jgi:hypothetical protein
LVARFLRRVKLANIVARKRKTRYWVKPPSKLQKKKKALRRVAYEAMEEFLMKTGKK